MKPSARRSGSLQRGQQRSGSARRLSDVHERPAWDATSSNLDKFKLTAEELERRKASRTSKNRPLATDLKRSFIEAWAKNVTTSASKPDTEPDQDRPRSSPAAGTLPINYSSVVDMLRRSPAPPAASSGTGDEAAPSAQEQQQGRASGTGTDSQGAVPNQLGLSNDASGSTPGDSHSNGDMGGAEVGPTRHAAGGTNSGEQAKQPAVRGANADRLAAAAASTSTGGMGGIGLHRAEMSVTPVGSRPRYNAAEATTIISFEEEDQEEGDVANWASPDPGLGTSGRADTMTEAFEAALLGKGRGGEATAAGVPLAWASDMTAPSPIGTAAGDVERRLRVLEEAIAVGGPRGDSLSPEEVAELRTELRKVQQDNAKLRQELSAFSTHASALLTQLQAQVQQLLRPSTAGAAGSGSLGGASTSSSYPRHPQPPQPSSEPSSNLPIYSAAPEQSAAVVYGTHAGRPQPVSQQPLHVTIPTATQPIVRRNIFADLDVSALRPPGSSAGASSAGVQAPMPSASPYTAYGGGASSRSAAAVPTGAAAPAFASLENTTAAPPAPRAVPVNNIDDAEVELPSFTAFRRSAGAAAFTAARPVATGNQGPLLSPSVPSSATAGRAQESAPYGTDASPHSATTAIQPRSFPTQYQPRALGGVLVRSGPGAAQAAPFGALNTGGVPMSAAAAAAASTSSSGAYAASLAASAAAAATGSGAAAVSLAREHSGLPQPLVFSVGPEFRTARASGLSAENSMSLSAHTAAAATLRAKASVKAAGSGPTR